MAEIRTSVAEILRTAREKAGRSLTDIAAELKIRERYLEALEAGDYGSLPPPAYAAGFVRSYAELLELDGRALARAYRDQAGGEAVAPDLHFPEPIAESRLPGRALLLTGLAGVIAIYFGWVADFTDSGSGTATAGSRVDPVPARLEEVVRGDVQEATGNAPPRAVVDDAGQLTASNAVASDEEPGPMSAAATTAMRQGPAPAALPAAARVHKGGGRVTVTATGDAWLRVVDAENHEVWSGVLRAGESWSPRSTADLRLMTSNAGAVVISVDGVALAPVGANGALVRDLALDPAELRHKARVALN